MRSGLQRDPVLIVSTFLGHWDIGNVNALCRNPPTEAKVLELEEMRD